MNAEDYKIGSVVFCVPSNFPAHPLWKSLQWVLSERRTNVDRIIAQTSCNHPLRHLFYRDASNGVRMYGYECSICYGMLGSWVSPKTLHAVVLSHAVPRNNELHHSWAEARNEKISNVSLRYKERIWKLKRTLYDAYVGGQSEEWKCRRAAVLLRDNHLCQVCKGRTATQVHHLRYDNLGNEPIEDLQSVCAACHAEIHQDAEIYQDID